MSALKKPKMEAAVTSSSPSSTTTTTASTTSFSRQNSSMPIPPNPPQAEMSDMEKRILSYIEQNPSCGGKSIHIGTSCPEDEMMVVLKKLLGLGEILVFEDANENLTFQIGTALSRRVAALPADAHALYSTIEAAGDKGIWHRSIKNKTNMEQQRIQRALKTLKLNNLIKEFYPVNSSKKKHYMLAHLKPANEVDGGTFYDNGKFDNDLVVQARKVFVKYLEKKHKDASSVPDRGLIDIYKHSYVPVKEVADWINRTAFFNVKLSEGDCLEVFKTLLDDNQVLAHPSKDETFRLSKISMPSSGVATTPCGRCPVKSKCVLGGVVNPTSCEYIAKWLDF
eukprot:m.169726 g.169726  ORF g.169726 m.169726 type:complete len:338 (-) comp13482_c0_seq5:2469-3482(-)